MLEAALASFALRGYEATSLDALAAGLGVRKQTILYYFASKEALLSAVVDRGAAELREALELAAAQTGRSAGRSTPDPLTAIVDAVFRLGARRPELLELLREILRLGPPASTRLTAELDPLLKGAATVLPERVVLTACAMVIGMATEVEVLRSLGVRPDRASLRRRRRELLSFLRAAVVGQECAALDPPNKGAP